MAYAAGRSGARLSVHTAQALATLAGIHANPLRELLVYKNTRMRLNIRVLHIHYLAWRLPISGPQGWSGSDKTLAVAGVYLSAGHKAGGLRQRRTNACGSWVVAIKLLLISKH